MKYYKLFFEDIENIVDDNNYNSVIDGTIDLFNLVQSQLSELQLQNYILKDNIIKCDCLPEFNIISPNKIIEVDEFGNLNQDDIKNLQIDDIILSKKRSIVLDYLRNNLHVNVKNEKIFGIAFDCPVCGKDNGKCFINFHNFGVMTYSKSDCIDKKHKKQFALIQKDLLERWTNTVEVKKYLYNLSDEYIMYVISRLPKIVKQKETNLLFNLNEDGFYQEMIENKMFSTLENLLYKICRVNTKSGNIVNMSSNQLRDLKNIIKNYKFDYVNFNDNDYINCKNGVIDLKENKLIENSNLYFTYKLDIEYNPDIESQKLIDFVKSVITEDEPILLFKKILGHIFYQGEKLQKGFIFLGTEKGRNGKGTLTKLITEIIGLNNSCLMSLENIQDSAFSTYNLKDKFLYVEDDYKLPFINNRYVSFLNKLIGGAYETVQQKGQPQITVKLKAVPILQCNKLPVLRTGDDGGFYKRFVIINFKNYFGDSDITDEFLIDKLLNNETKSTLLNWLIQGLQLIRERKENNVKGEFFNTNSDELIQSWKTENNQVHSFIKDECVLGNNMEISTRELYFFYIENWNLKGSKLSEVKFVSEVLNYNPNICKKRVRIDGIKKTMFYGIGLQ